MKSIKHMNKQQKWIVVGRLLLNKSKDCVSLLSFSR
jgi:hypothetical protein